MTITELPRAQHACSWGLSTSECHACNVERHADLDPALGAHVSAFEFVGGEHPEMRVLRTDGREAIFDIAVLGETIVFIGANDAAQGLMFGDISGHLARHLALHMEHLATHA